VSPGNLLILGSNVKVRNQTTGASVGLCTLVSAGFFYFVIVLLNICNINFQWLTITG